MPPRPTARGLVDKALQAETDGLWGRAYFDLRNITDPVAASWATTGFAALPRSRARWASKRSWTYIPNVWPAGFPMDHIAIYMGWYTENVAGPFAQPQVEFMPGAFAYHLHSFSAASLRSTNHNWVGPLLAKGATCTMGCVDEPYLGGTPEVGVFAGRWLYFGFTFGEAACAAQPVLSWQTTVVGDPLYRPFGKAPLGLHEVSSSGKARSSNGPSCVWSTLASRAVGIRRPWRSPSKKPQRLGPAPS